MRQRAWRFLAECLLLAVVCAAAYSNSFAVPFVFDDLDSIVNNPNIRDLSDLRAVVTPPDGSDVTVAGRPVAALSLALNYAISGLDVWSYHVFNLAVHVAAAIVLLALARTLLGRVGFAEPAARGIALAVALLWALHPLQTMSVTYVVQRVESMVGLCYLLTLLAFARGCEGGRRGWFVLAAVACCVGVGVKEVIVTAPVAVWLMDRAFYAGSFAGALRRRWAAYAGLGVSWVLIGVSLPGSSRIGMAGEALAAFGPWDHARIQCVAIPRYVQLALWPAGLTFDYGGPYLGARLTEPAVKFYAGAVVPAALLGATVWLVVRRPRLGFVAAAAFLVLAPSSSVVPLPLETMAEHRMYLPLAAVAVFVVLGVRALLCRVPTSARHGAAVGLAAVAAVSLGVGTWQRNRVYASELTLWQDTVAKRPDNARARTSLAIALYRGGSAEAALAEARAAAGAAPGYSYAQYTLAVLAATAGRVDEAVAAYEAAIDAAADMTAAYQGLSELLFQRGQAERAVQVARDAAVHAGGDPGASILLARTLLRVGDATGALAAARAALEAAPEDPRASNLTGRALLELGRPGEPVAHFERVLALQPDFPGAREKLDQARRAAGR
ncbi:MAG: hypothetical protein AMXMBFR47_35450 [Planctomycetota bacterium]